MGCGAGKTTRESVLDAHAPADKPKLKPVVVEKPKATKPGLVAEPSNKLDSEVLEGLAKLLRRFSTIEVGKSKSKSLKPQDFRALTALGKDSSHPKQVSSEAKAIPQGTIPVQPVHKQAEEEVKPVFTEEIKPATEQKEAMQITPDPEPMQAFNGPAESSMEQRYSPEPPRPDDPSDDESLHTEDASLKRQRLEREQHAREEAERLAAEQRLEQEKQAALQKGKITSMESQAQDILSKYQ
jgi:hypothetical protein